MTTHERDDTAKRQKTLIIQSLHKGLVRIISLDLFEAEQRNKGTDLTICRSQPVYAAEPRLSIAFHY